MGDYVVFVNRRAALPSSTEVQSSVVETIATTPLAVATSVAKYPAWAWWLFAGSGVLIGLGLVRGVKAYMELRSLKRESDREV